MVGLEIGLLQMIPAPNNIVVQPGQAIIWSVGPDRRDNDGILAHTNPWANGRGDIISIVPLPAKLSVKKP